MNVKNSNYCYECGHKLEFINCKFCPNCGIKFDLQFIPSDEPIFYRFQYLFQYFETDQIIHPTPQKCLIEEFYRERYQKEKFPLGTAGFTSIYCSCPRCNPASLANDDYFKCSKIN